MVLREIKGKLEELGAKLGEDESLCFCYDYIAFPNRAYFLRKDKDGLKISVNFIWGSADCVESMSEIPRTYNKAVIPRRAEKLMTLEGFIFHYLRRRTHGVADDLARELGIALPEPELDRDVERFVSGMQRSRYTPR